MSHINEIHSVIIIDNKNAGNYTKMIDAFKPKGATKCYVTVSKFEASVDVPDDYLYGTHNVVLSINGVENAYVNDSQSNIITRSQIIDTFLTSNFKIAKAIVGGANVNYAIYSVINSHENWIQVNMNDLNNFVINMKTASSQSDMINNITYSQVSDNSFQFFLHLRIKFM